VPGRDIFISYSREDRAAARHFSKCFAEEGFSVWWDATLQAGQTFDEVIEQELKNAKAVVVLWSPRSVRSRWVRAEATLADRSNKLVPAIIEACDRPIIFELTHTADLANWTGDRTDSRWRTYVEDIRDLVDRSNAAEQAATAAPPPPPVRENPIVGRTAANPTPATPQPYGRTPPPAMPAHGDEDDEDDRTQFYIPPKPAEDVDDEFHCLEMTAGGHLQKRYVVSPIGIRIGRTAPADIIIPDPGVSRLHCKVELAGDKLRVVDLNSTNGTYVEGQRIGGEALLEVGAVLRIGNISLKHEIRTRASVQ
jgi:hypothetical protein